MITIQNMKLLLTALSLATKAANNKSSMPALAMVRLTNLGKALRTVATDLETWQYSTIPTTTVGAPLDVAVNAKALALAVKKLKADALTLEAVGDKLELRSGKRKLALGTFPVENLPIEPEPTQRVIEFDKAEFYPAWEFTSKAISKDSTRPHLQVIHVETAGFTARLVATDGHRLNLVNVVGRGGNLDGVTNVPDSVAQAMLSTMKAANGSAHTVGFGADDAYAVLYCGNHTVVGKLNDAGGRDYPPYDRVIPTYHDTVVKVDTDALREAADLAGAINSGGNHGAAFLFGPSTVQVSAEDPDMGEVSETLSVTYAKTCDDTDGFRIGFDTSYILDAVKDRKGDVTLSFSDNYSPMVMRWDGSDSLAVIMPLRL